MAILISGRGSNMQALVGAVRQGRIDADVRCVVSNRPDAAGLAWAAEARLTTHVLAPHDGASRESYDRGLVALLRDHGVQLVCLAGFMRVLSPVFVSAFPGAALNVHPSLLPAFPGAHAQAQALTHGVTVTGVTVHFVTEGLDAGPIVAQAPVPVRSGDTVDTLSARVLEEEHRLYPLAVQKVIRGGWRLDGRRVLWPTMTSEESKAES